MESHRAAGRFVAERWCLGRIPGKPEAASVLLMAEIPGRDVWEVVYLGLTPAARGHGLGRAVLRHALELAERHVPGLELAVDCRNRPATRLYQSDRLHYPRPPRGPPGYPRPTFALNVSGSGNRQPDSRDQQAGAGGSLPA